MSDGFDPLSGPTAPTIDPSIGAQAGPVAPPPDPTMGPLGTLSGAPPQAPADGSAANPYMEGNGVQANLAPDTKTGATPSNQPFSWRDVLRGALVGMAGASQNRGGSFGGGIGAGAGAEFEDQRKTEQVKMQQQQLQFESVRAADSHIAALDQHRRVGALMEEDQLRLKELNQKVMITDRDEFGIEPKTTVSDTDPTEANAALTTLAAANGGTIPAVTTTNHPAEKGTAGTIAVNATLPQDVKNNDTGLRKHVDAGRAMQGLGPISDQDWMHGGPKEKAIKNDAATGILGTPTDFNYDASKGGAKYIETMIATRTQQAASVHKRNDAAVANGGQPVVPPDVLKNFEDGTTFLQKVSASHDKNETIQKGGGAVDPANVKTFTDQTLPSYTHIPTAQSNALGVEASQAKTVSDFEKLQIRADASEKSGQIHSDTVAKTQADKATTFGNAGLTANEKVLNDPKTGYSATLAQVNVGTNSIKAGVDGNGLLTSLVPTMEVLGMNHFSGNNRISPTEAAAAGAPGGYAEQFNAWADKAAKGKLSPQLAQEGQQLMNILGDAKFRETVRNQQVIAQGHGLSPSNVPAMDRQGNVTTLDKVMPQQEGTTNMRGPDGTIHPILNSQVKTAASRGAVVVK